MAGVQGFEALVPRRRALAAAAGLRWNAASNYWFMCTTFAGGKPLKYVADAMLYAPMFSA